MRVTRRAFIECAAAAVSLRWRLGAPSSPPDPTSRWALLDLGQHCALGESLTGYAAALGSHVPRSDASSPPQSAGLIVPGAARLPPAAVDAITTSLDGGGFVILESGAGFASARDFTAHRTVLRGVLNVRVERPVALWPQSRGAAFPYVDFTWPIRTRVRDFSRVVPLASEAGETIAGVNGHAVGIRRRSGRGTLVVLGSPLGPALWAGDTEATRWLQAVLAT